MENRRPLIAGNWKMYKTVREAADTARQLAGIVSDASHADVMIAPSFTALAAVSEAVGGSRVSVGAQNLFWEKEGAYTGEISSDMIVSAGCRYVIIGHSERRQYFNETDETVNKKLKRAIDAQLIPILCVGETENERDSQQTFSVLDKQIRDGIKDIFSKDLETLVIAYEPVWAIGTGKTATRDQAEKAHEFIRSVVEKSHENGLAKSMRILYGGSVKPDNIAGLMEMPDIDGALVGGASLDAETFGKIVHYRKS